MNRLVIKPRAFCGWSREIGPQWLSLAALAGRTHRGSVPLRTPQDLESTRQRAAPRPPHSGCCAVLQPTPLLSTPKDAHVRVDDTSVAASCIIVDARGASHRNPRADDLPCAYWSVLWDRPHHPTADRSFALKQTAVTVSCYLDLRVVTGHSLADWGGCAAVWAL